MEYNNKQRKYKRYNKICVLDTETTDKYWNTAAPVQIAAIIVDNSGNIVDSFNEKIKTTHEINPEASEVNRIFAKDLINCRSERPVIEDFVSWIMGNGCDCFLTYNGKAFDIPMLNERCRVLGLNNIKIFDKNSKESLPHIDGYYDCVYIAKKQNLYGLKDKLGRKWKLTLVSSILGIDTEGAHDALVDVTMLKDVFFTLDPQVHPTDWEDSAQEKTSGITDDTTETWLF